MFREQKQSTATPLTLAALKSLSFMQQKLDRPGVTHVLLVKAALERLCQSDSATARALSPCFNSLAQGALWADSDWKNCNHYYHPTEKRGMWLFSNAVNECEFYFDAAKRAWQESRFSDGAFFLGAAVHLVQDVCVPYHTIPQLILGHRFFEEYAEKRATYHMHVPQGPVTPADTVGGMVRDNAEFSSLFLRDLIKHASDAYETVLSSIVPVALNSTIQAFDLFIRQSGTLRGDCSEHHGGLGRDDHPLVVLSQ